MKVAPLALFAVLTAIPRAQAKAFFLADTHDTAAVYTDNVEFWERFVMESGSMSIETKAPSTPINPAPPTSVPTTAQPSPLVSVDTPSPTAFDTSVMPSPTTSAPIPSAPVPDINPAPPTGAPVPDINPAPPTGPPIPVINPPPNAPPLPPAPVVSGPTALPSTAVPVASAPSTGAPVNAPISAPETLEIDCSFSITGCVTTHECPAAGAICDKNLTYYYNIFNVGNTALTITRAERTYDGSTASFLFVFNSTTIAGQDSVSVGESRGPTCTDVTGTAVTIGVAEYNGVACSRRRLRR